MQRNPNVAKKIRSSTGKSDQIGSAEGVDAQLPPLLRMQQLLTVFRVLDGETPRARPL